MCCFPREFSASPSCNQKPTPTNQISNDFSGCVGHLLVGFCCVFSTEFSAFALKEKVNGAVDSWPLVMCLRCPLLLTHKPLSHSSMAQPRRSGFLLLPGLKGHL